MFFVDESGFSINMRRPTSGWTWKRKPAVVDTPTGKAVSYTVLGTITTKFVVFMELRNPPQEGSSKRIKIEFSNRKRKPPTQKKSQLQKTLPLVIT